MTSQQNCLIREFWTKCHISSRIIYNCKENEKKLNAQRISTENLWDAVEDYAMTQEDKWLWTDLNREK